MEINQGPEFPPEFQGNWRNYFEALSMACIRMIDQDEELVWAFSPHGIYTQNGGVRIVVEGGLESKVISKGKTANLVHNG